VFVFSSFVILVTELVRLHCSGRHSGYAACTDDLLTLNHRQAQLPVRRFCHLGRRMHVLTMHTI